MSLGVPGITLGCWMATEKSYQAPPELQTTIDEKIDSLLTKITTEHPETKPKKAAVVFQFFVL